MDQREKMEYLKQYRIAGAAERRLREELAMWRSTAEKVTATLSPLPRGQGDGTGHLERAVERLAELETALGAALEERVRLRLAVNTAIQTVPDDRLRYLLERRYVDGCTWEQIALDMDLTYQWTCALHKKALDLIAIDS